MIALAIISCGGGGGSGASTPSTAGNGSAASSSGSTETTGTTSGAVNKQLQIKLQGMYTGAVATLQSNTGNSVQITGNGTYQIEADVSGGLTKSIKMAKQPVAQNCTPDTSTTSSTSNDSDTLTLNCGSLRNFYFEFTGPPNAATTNGKLVIDASGNLYGTSSSGGAYGKGLVYTIAPDGTETDLYSFGTSSTDGTSPQNGLLMDAAGNLYGVTQTGGQYGQGTVYKLTQAGVESVLYSFGAYTGDGTMPLFALIMDGIGNIYGTTLSGGANLNYGTVFKLAPDGMETILHSFAFVGDGFYPEGTLYMDGSGNLFGTTVGGGTGTLGHGTLYEIDSTGNYSTLYSFGQTAVDAAEPQSGLIADASGNLYGTSVGGGTYGNGSVYSYSPGGSVSVLYSFGAVSNDGSQPQTELTMDMFGNLFGTTMLGGANNLGTVFVITPLGIQTTVFSFDALVNGAYPESGLAIDAYGNLYGTTVNGGGPGWGTIYQIY